MFGVVGALAAFSYDLEFLVLLIEILFITQPLQLPYQRASLSQKCHSTHVNTFNRYFEIFIKLKELSLLRSEIFQIFCLLIELHKCSYFLLLSGLIPIGNRMYPHSRFETPYFQ